MNVIMIGSHLRVTGGITRVVKNYIEADLGKKVNLEYFPTYYGAGHVVNIIYFIIQFLKLFIKINILSQKYDVAHIHMSYRGSFVRKRQIINLLAKANIPVILHMHGSQFKDFYNESNDKKKQQIVETLNKVKVILALGEQWKSYYESICETEVISLDNAVFPKQSINNTADKIYITTMGVLSQRKGTYDLIEVGARLKGKIDNKYKFVLAGDGEIDKVKKKIADLGLDDLFIVPGWISDDKTIEEIYQKTIIYVLPSYNEGMPMSILEAMSYGLPIISTNVGSIASVVKESNGYIIEPGDVERLYNNILQMLNNPQDLELMSRENVNKITSEYNIFKSLENLVPLYKKVTN
ncbi:glycosyltransferase family 4 protein [Ectobacillus antri]|uniref:Glycosyltransferase family 4 protein n=1 Tax=Ectobacillus antri TaxID=2486280 RepID=A0ABT6H838_9BACI|nr:glycosyltransferase family 4 protein [Ectobacillus antri]MDG4658482.1 glycosyltransferase family 4 protein [Ectobacillus antri]MDG5755492.1 glycosyltransferase family 4 protein [Ectobacillus antri]